ncbi:MAG TPA: DUF3043 domain-containing protein [Mycobacteriales bacterium]|nr:DUF3043 domain-containing protein [Mycobacteriales bacterium]
MTDEAPTGKGRPTPKRRDARKQRRLATPKNRKEAAALRRERLREQRANQRRALQTGDERHLPARDAGPAKKLARDYVDGRFTMGQIFFGMIIVVFGLAFVPAAAATANLVVVVAFLAVVIDSVRVGRGARRAVEEKYGAKDTTGIIAYAMLRSMQPRRMRRPPAPKRS